MVNSDFSAALPAALQAKVRTKITQLKRAGIVRRIWTGDKTAWTNADEDRWLGWLGLPADRAGIGRLTALAASVVQEGVSDLVLLGMGGSSLAPEVLRAILGVVKGHPRLHVVDSTDPAQIAAVERQIELTRTLFLVASKSGSTLEVNILKQYFYERAVKALGGAEAAGRRFIVTTDPGSKMEQIARDEHFRDVFYGVPSVGGRYSALSNFGMVPAAVIGADVAQLLDRAEAMAVRSKSDGDDNQPFELGVILGVLAVQGRDKPTLIAPPALASFGVWLEQLIAESLGKQGKGVIPIEGEAPGPPVVYGNDRVFVQLRLAGEPDAVGDAHARELERAGHPVLRIEWSDRYAIGGEFFRWEFATAVMGAVIGVNPFDQPDVEAAKVVTRRLAGEYEATGSLPQGAPLYEADGLSLFGDARAVELLGRQHSLEAYLRAFLSELTAGDYFAILAFIEMSPAHERVLQAVRMLVRDHAHVATTVGFGPRFLHSTGQAHKGGPNTGVFLQITADSPKDLPVPGQRYSFGTIKLAQASGDLEVLSERKRRLLRVHLQDVTAGLESLHTAIRAALS